MVGTGSDIVVKFGADLTQLKAGMAEAKGEGEDLGSSLGSKLGSIGTMAAAGVGVAGVAIAAFAVKSAEDVDGAYKSIEKQTGATGTALNGLKGSFNTVFGNFPISSADAATAVSTVYDRLKDMQGGVPPTQAVVTSLTSAFEEFATVTGTSVATDTDQLMKTFAQFHEPASSMAASLNDITQASQYAHIPVSQLQSDMIKAGPTYAAAGVSVDDMTASIAQMDSSGVKSRTAISGLNTGMAALEKSGDTSKQAFSTLTQELDKYATTGVKTGEVSKLSGTALVQLTAAAKSGAFDFDTLTGKMYTNSGAMEKSYEDTRTFSQRLDIFKNKLELAFAPLGESIIGLLESFLAAITPLLPIITSLVTVFTSLPMPIQMIGMAFIGLVGGVGALQMVLKLFDMSITKLPADIAKVTSALKDMNLQSKVTNLVAPKVGGGGAAGEAAEGAEVAEGGGAAGEAEGVATGLGAAAGEGGILAGVLAPITALLGGMLAPIMGTVTGIAGAVTSGGSFLEIIGSIAMAFNPITIAIAAIGAGFMLLYATSNTFRTSIGALVSQFMSLLGWVMELVSDLTSLNFSKFSTDLVSGIKGGLDTVKNDIMGLPGMLVTAIGESVTTIGGIFDKIGGMLMGAFNSVKNIDWGGMVNGLLTAIDNVLTGLLNFDPTSMINNIINAIGAAFDSLFGGGGGSSTSPTGTKVSGGMSKGLSDGVSKAGPDILGKLGDVFVKLMELLPTIFIKVATALGEALAKVDLGQIGGKILTAMETAFVTFWSTVGAIVPKIGGWMLSAFVTFWSAVPGYLSQIGGWMLNAFKTVWGPVGNDLKNALMGALGGIGAALGGAFDSLKKIDWGGAILNLFKLLGSMGVALGTALLNAFKMVNWLQIFTLIFVTLVYFGQAILKALTGIDWGGALLKLWTALSTGFDKVLNILETRDWGGMALAIWNALIAKLTGIVNWFKGLDWGGYATTVWNALTGAIGGMVTWLQGLPWATWATDLWNALTGAIGGMVTWLKGLPWADWATGLWNDIVSALGGFGTWLLTAAEGFFTGLPGKITSAVSGFGDWLLTGAAGFFTGLPGGIKGQIGGLGDWLTTAAAGFFTGIPGAFQSALGQVHVTLDTTPPFLHISLGAEGALVPAKPGGSLYLLGEANEEELVVPRRRWGEDWSSLVASYGGSFASGGIVGSTNTPSGTVRTSQTSSSSQTINYNTYVSVDSENVTRKVLMSNLELERYHHMNGF